MCTHRFCSVISQNGLVESRLSHLTTVKRQQSQTLFDLADCRLLIDAINSM